MSSEIPSFFKAGIAGIPSKTSVFRSMFQPFFFFCNQFLHEKQSAMPETQPLPTGFSTADLDRLAKLVQNRRCALILGPLASCDAQGRPLRQLLANEIADAFLKKATALFGEKARPLPDPDNLSLAATAFDKLPEQPHFELEELVQNFYEIHSEPSALLKKVAELPFRLVFTAAPDMLLQKAFLQVGKRKASSDFYWFGRTQTDGIGDVPRGETFIYQLFGRAGADADSSLVLTIGDQLAFIDSIQGPGKETHLPAGLRKEMLECEAFLFVGFDYENWYLKVLFHILKFSENARLVFGLPEGRSAEISEATADFFKHQYKFSFLADRPLALLEGIRERIDSPKNAEPLAAGRGRSLLFIHHPNALDEAIRLRIDKQLSAARRNFSLASTTLHEFESGSEADIFSKKIREATAIVILFSADLVADDGLMGLAEAAIARSSPSVTVVGVNARPVAGLGGLFQNRLPVYPSLERPLSQIDDDSGAKMVADCLEKHFQNLPRP